MNSVTLLQTLEDIGVTISVEQDKLTLRGKTRSLTPEIKEALTDKKLELLALLSTLDLCDGRTVSAKGVALLLPYLEVIKSARRRELAQLLRDERLLIDRNLPIIEGRGSATVSDYVCRICSGIWYGVTLEHPLLPMWLENLAHLQARWDHWQSVCIYCVRRPAVYPVPSAKVSHGAQTICEECYHSWHSSSF